MTASNCWCRPAGWFRRSSRSPAPVPAPGSPMAAARPTARRSTRTTACRCRPDNPSYTLRRVWLRKKNSRATTSASPMRACGRFAISPSPGRSSAPPTGSAYEAVNRKFADTVVAEARNERPIVLVQDYHFALLPRMIRERLPEAIIITFWHIPWPNSEVFSICPWRERDSRRVARQLDHRLPHPVPLQQFHRKRRPLPGKPHRPRGCGDLLWRPDDAGASPIRSRSNGRAGVWQSCPRSRTCRAPDARAVRTAAGRQAVRRRRAARLHQGHSRPVPALDELFHQTSRMDRASWSSCRSRRPAAARCRPTSSCIEECLRYVDELNERYGSDGYKPVMHGGRTSSPGRVYEMSIAPPIICMVTSLHDGMNLVAKEFVAARDDEQGVLVAQHLCRRLARTAGGADRQPLRRRRRWARRCCSALTMPPDEQRERMRPHARDGPKTTMSTAGPAACFWTRRGCASAAISAGRRVRPSGLQAPTTSFRCSSGSGGRPRDEPSTATGTRTCRKANGRSSSISTAPCWNMPLIPTRCPSARNCELFWEPSSNGLTAPSPSSPAVLSLLRTGCFIP